MPIVIPIVLAVNLVAIVVLVFAARRLRSRVQALTERVAALAGAPLALESSVVAGKKRLITVELLNPIDMAAAQNKYSGMAGAVAPELIRSIVYKKAAEALRDGLVEQGVEAEVIVHVGA